MRRAEVLAYLRSLGVGEIRDIVVEARVSIGWSHYDDDGLEVWPDDDDSDDDVVVGQLRGAAGELIASISHASLREPWFWRLSAQTRGEAPRRADAEARAEEAAIAAGYVLPWRTEPDALIPPARGGR